MPRTLSQKLYQSSVLLLFFMSMVVVSFGGARADEKALKAEEKQMFPHDEELPGNPPESGIRYWSEFQPLPYAGAYVSVIIRNNVEPKRYELWQNTWGEKGAESRQIVVRKGADLKSLGEPEVVFDGTIIEDVPDPKNPETLAPGRGFTRPAVMYDPQQGYVMLVCVAPDYLPGSVPLLPAILVSKTGQKGDWKYLGTLKGDPQKEAEKRKIWSDCGSIVRLDDWRWRIYLNGYGPVVSALESESLEGPWAFLRDDEGNIRELLTEFPRDKRRGGCFPTVLRVADNEWHLWITDKWPPQTIWHFFSDDGLSWRRYGDQPEITRAAFDGRGIKCLRAYYEPAEQRVFGLLSVRGILPDGNTAWILHFGELAPGPPQTINRAVD
jgi:hypothetical protein